MAQLKSESFKSFVSSCRVLAVCFDCGNIGPRSCLLRQISILIASPCCRNKNSYLRNLVGEPIGCPSFQRFQRGWSFQSTWSFSQKGEVKSSSLDIPWEDTTAVHVASTTPLVSTSQPSILQTYSIYSLLEFLPLQIL